jgi:hypothetical protein
MAKNPTSADVNGVPLKPGDTVRNGGLYHNVEAVGRGDMLAGYIMVSGLLGWHAANRFEKVPKD